MGLLPPLTEPADDLTPDERIRYSRHTILPGVGPEGQRRLKNARVLVIGAGGLGAPALLYLAAAGVGTLGVVEFDDVEASNLQRQVIHGQSDIGRAKGASARDSILEINPSVTVNLHPVRLDNSNAVEIFRDYDLVLDGTDNFATRYLVNDAAAIAHKPYVWGSIFRFEGQVAVFWQDAPDGRGVTYRDLYPQAPPPGSVPSCAEGGVFGVLCATIGSFMTTEALKLITGLGESLLGRVLIYDALAMSVRTIALRRDPGAEPITALTDYEAFCGVPAAPSAMQAISPRDLSVEIASGRPLRLIDVREPVEWDIARLPGATLVPSSRLLSAADVSKLGELRGIARDQRLVVYCKTGIRSAQALERMRDAGYTDVTNLDGGIDAWSVEVDPAVPRY